MKLAKKEEIINNLIEILDTIIEEEGVPRNIKRSVTQAKELISEKDEKEVAVKAATAINLLEELVNDPNTPIHVRTLILQAISQLELLTKI